MSPAGASRADPRPSEPFLARYAPPRIAGDFTGKHVVSVDQFARDDLEILFEATRSIRRRLRQRDRGLLALMAGRLMATLFYEASTRTDLSFQAAMRHLGGEVVAASNGVRFSSIYKGENLADTVRAAGCFADVLVLRHPSVGSSYEAAHYLDLLAERTGRAPVVISAGDGVGEHPTQALLDLFTIHDAKGGLDGRDVTLVGDLKHGRTVHSLAKLIARYAPRDATLNLVSPHELRMPADVLGYLEERGVRVRRTDDLGEVLGGTDVVYWTRVQEERFEDAADYAAIADRFVMTPRVFADAKDDAILMHPLPRKNEMGDAEDQDALDRDPRSVYFEQMENGMFVRMALLAKVLGGLWV